MTKQKFQKIKKTVQKMVDLEFKKYGPPIHYVLCNTKGQELAAKLKADTQVVELGTMLMDFKIGYALKVNKLKEHTMMAVKDVGKLFNKLNIESDFSDQVAHCIQAHHGDIKYQSLEAEICANADCYKFLTCSGVADLILSLKGELEGREMLELVEFKVEEKYKTLSLDLAKKELLPNYKLIKKFLKQAKKEI